MKNIIATLFLLFSILLVLLATVDLEPLLKKGSADDNLQKSSPANSTPKQTTDQAPLSEQVTAPVSESFAEKQQKNIAPGKAEETIAKKTEDPTTNKPFTGSDITQKTEIIGTELIKLEDGLDLEVMMVDENDLPYSILLATFVKPAIAEQAIPFYRRQNISTHWVKVKLAEDNTRYRLFTGAFSTKDEAQKYMQHNQLSDGLIKKTRYAARIGIFQNKTQLAKAYSKIQNTEAVPYILATKAGIFHLYAGAFYTFEGASDQCDKLLEAGINCQPVSRSTLP